FAERHLDRSQVVLGQITKRRAPGFDRFAYARNFVCRKIVHDHDVFAFDRGSERLLDICEERLSAHRAIDHARRRHPIPAQAGYEGKGFPVSLRYAANQSLAARAPAVEIMNILIRSCTISLRNLEQYSLSAISVLAEWAVAALVPR